MLSVVGWGAGVVPGVWRGRFLPSSQPSVSLAEWLVGYLDDEGGHRVGVQTGVWYLDVVLVGVVDDLTALVPVDVGGRPGAVLHPALQPHRGALVYVEIFRADYQGSGFWNNKEQHFNENSDIHICGNSDTQTLENNSVWKINFCSNEKIYIL